MKIEVDRYVYIYLRPQTKFKNSDITHIHTVGLGSLLMWRPSPILITFMFFILQQRR